jgi:hypothetical protein
MSRNRPLQEQVTGMVREAEVSLWLRLFSSSGVGVKLSMLYLLSDFLGPPQT